MQWLIDIIAQKVIDTIGIPPCYYILTGSNYFLIDKFIVDGQEHEFDLSSLIPIGTTAINIQARAKSSDGNGIWFIRPPGSSPLGSCHMRPQVANKDISIHSVVGMTESRSFMYKFYGDTWTSFALKVRGYFL